MTRLNEPCPCGSGRSHGDCCGKDTGSKKPEAGKSCTCGSGKKFEECCGKKQ